VFANNERAIALYNKSGFEIEGNCPKDMKMEDGTYIDSILMYKIVK
jgi:RimJ/RimL family protein N-acetyltransferase